MKVFRIVAVVTLCCTVVLGAHGQQSTEKPSDQSLRKFLQTYLVGLAPGSEAGTRFASARVRLSGGTTEEVVVYLMGRNWCGSGGCTALVLAPEGPSYKVITKTTVTRLPIRILATRTNGWRDLGVMVLGGGTSGGHEAQLRYNGKKYPSNPTVPPAQKSKPGTLGDVIIPNTIEGTSLFP